MVCTRSTAKTPEVGFCFGCFLLSFGGISSRLTVHTARMGTPFEANRVYLALTCVTKAGKLAIPPQWNSTSGGIGNLARDFSIGIQQLTSVSTASTTL